MKIFLSVAGPDRPQVEEVALALRDEGHLVFLDEHELPAGSSYHRRIREAIAQADLAVFFISPLSVQTDRYTLSELKLMQDKWPHPRGRVLPTMITPTDFSKVPAYLKAVTIYKPKGNVAAEVAYEVSRMASAMRRGGGGRGQDAGGRATGIGGIPLEPITRGAVAAFALGALATLTSVLANQLADFLTGWPPSLVFVFHGVVLALTVWLAGLLFGIRDPVAFGVLAAGCIAAYLFEYQAGPTMRGQLLPVLYAGKSMIFALFAAMALPAFRSIVSWASLAVLALVAGQLAHSLGQVFVWEALFVATVAFFLALTEPDVARAT
jgi:hypothetical protein